MQIFARAEPYTRLPLPRQCPSPCLGELYTLLFSPYNSILNSHYSMKSETFPTGKTGNSLLIKVTLFTEAEKGTDEKFPASG